MDALDRLTGLLGVAALVGTAVLLSRDRAAIRWRTVGAGLLLQFALAFLLLRFPPVVAAFDLLAAAVAKVISFADEGTRFLFGPLADPSGAWGFVFAVKVLPIIVFFAALMGVLYHLGVMQRLIALFALALRRVLGVTGVEAMSAAANIFVGQTEAPLTVRPYIARMTRSQLMCVMAGGFATIAGSVMAAYISMLGGDDPAARTLVAKHFMTACVMSAPAAILFAKAILPETEEPVDAAPGAPDTLPRTTANVLDAAAEGATDGLRLALNVGAMLVAFVSLIALVNWPLAAISALELDWLPVASWRADLGLPVLTFENILGTLLRPVAWLMGAGAESAMLGAWMGKAVIATEFVAYADLAGSIRAGAVSPRTQLIATFALCGFANLPSIAIQIGGLSAMAPERRADLAALAPRAMVAGAFACWTTGAVAGVLAP